MTHRIWHKGTKYVSVYDFGDGYFVFRSEKTDRYYPGHTHWEDGELLRKRGFDTLEEAKSWLHSYCYGA